MLVFEIDTIFLRVFLSGSGGRAGFGLGFRVGVRGRPRQWRNAKEGKVTPSKERRERERGGEHERIEGLPSVECATVLVFVFFSVPLNVPLSQRLSLLGPNLCLS